MMSFTFAGLKLTLLVTENGYTSFVFLEKRVKTKSVCLLAIMGNDVPF